MSQQIHMVSRSWEETSVKAWQENKDLHPTRNQILLTMRMSKGTDPPLEPPKRNAAMPRP